MNLSQTISQIKESGIIAIIRGNYPQARVLAIGAALAESGVTVMEVTLNTPGALEAIAALRRSAGGHTLVVGAGTVRTAAQADAALDAGAQFLVAPNFDPETAGRARARSVPLIPGIFTATEAQTAWAAGCAMVKLFPAHMLGPAYLKALRAPLDDIAFVPTGGIGPDNAGEYRRAGAVAVGVGSSLVRDADQSDADLRARAAALRTAWDAAASHAAA